MDTEVKEGSVPYVASTPSMAPAPRAAAGAHSDADAVAQERAASFRRYLEQGDDEMRTLISANPRVLHGAPAIAGTRIPVHMVLGLIAQGYSVSQVVKLYSHVTEAQVRAAIRFASLVLEAPSGRQE